MNYSEITPYIEKLAERSCENNHITADLYPQYNVKKGLRDVDGTGVVAGLTEVSCINSMKREEDGSLTPIRGELYYRGINVRDLVSGFTSEGRSGFEEAVYLLLFSKLPTTHH